MALTCQESAYMTTKRFAVSLISGLMMTTDW
jgi:hypothetical protein